eukprot:GILK01011310.1.p1 GENE.GILK01011310.1~~GILK01011310.1.p1  ORF type:complete len:378 (-),score=70.51 GILK01011310.1:151-1284(-)
MSVAFEDAAMEPNSSVVEVSSPQLESVPDTTPSLASEVSSSAVEVFVRFAADSQLSMAQQWNSRSSTQSYLSSLVAIFACFLPFFSSRWSIKDKFITLMFAGLWLWIAGDYFFKFRPLLLSSSFDTYLSYIFGALFLLQGGLFWRHMGSSIGSRVALSYCYSQNGDSSVMRQLTAFFLCLAGVVILPFADYQFGQDLLEVNYFPSPSPLSLVTLAFLSIAAIVKETDGQRLLQSPAAPWYMFVVPSVWLAFKFAIACVFNAFSSLLMMESLVALWLLLRTRYSRYYTHPSLETSAAAAVEAEKARIRALPLLEYSINQNGPIQSLDVLRWCRQDEDGDIAHEFWTALKDGSFKLLDHSLFALVQMPADWLLGCSIRR